MNEKGLVAALDPATHTKHPFHTAPRVFAETNCYVDLWIGVLHALQLPAAACLGFGFGSTFEGDQWTFVKPSHGDLERLYGIGVEELSLWRSLLDHVNAQVSLGRIPLIEMDAFYLPDAQGTDYRRAHVKTTVGIAHLDAAHQRLHYFHNAGFHALNGDDFDGLFRLDRATPDDYLPPYCEVIKLEQLRRRSLPELRELARTLSQHHFDKRPTSNPITRYGEQMAEHMRWLIEGDEALFHAYSFSSLRQVGTAFEVLAEHLRWLREERGESEAARSFDTVAAVAKRVMLKLARVSHTKRAADVTPAFTEMADAWQRGMDLASDELSHP